MIRPEDLCRRYPVLYHIAWGRLALSHRPRSGGRLPIPDFESPPTESAGARSARRIVVEALVPGETRLSHRPRSGGRLPIPDFESPPAQPAGARSARRIVVEALVPGERLELSHRPRSGGRLPIPDFESPPTESAGARSARRIALSRRWCLGQTERWCLELSHGCPRSRRARPDFESGASTDFATQARRTGILRQPSR